MRTGLIIRFERYVLLRLRFQFNFSVRVKTDMQSRFCLKIKEPRTWREWKYVGHPGEAYYEGNIARRDRHFVTLNTSN